MIFTHQMEQLPANGERLFAHNAYRTVVTEWANVKERAAVALVRAAHRHAQSNILNADDTWRVRRL